MDPNDRIARFEHMAQADPENDMAHFSLGGAYAQAGRHEDAASSYRRCVEVNPDMSKAYQLAGAELVKAGKQDEAVPLLQEGYKVAARLGDMMPRNAIADLLKELGAEVPELDAQTKRQMEEIAASGSFICRSTGRPGTKMDRPPFRGPVGAWIGENIAVETWRAWIAQGTKVINELRLDLSREQDQETYDKHMREFLGIDDDLYAQLRAKSGNTA